MLQQTSQPYWRQYWRELILGLLILSSIAIVAVLDPIPQDPKYHLFVDVRSLAGLPNFWNVVSNAGFLLVGVIGLLKMGRLAGSPMKRKQAYVAFCIGIVGVSAGSAYYHYIPSIQSLVWDRMPITIAFMALFSIVAGDRVSRPLGDALLFPAMTCGIASVAYWYWSEQHGTGDLRAYGVVQFLPMLLIPAILLMFAQRSANRTSDKWLWAMFAAYGCAKVCELFDAAIYRQLEFISGHSLKHVAGAVAVWFALKAIWQFEPPAGNVPDPLLQNEGEEQKSA